MVLQCLYLLPQYKSLQEKEVAMHNMIVIMHKCWYSIHERTSVEVALLLCLIAQRTVMSHNMILQMLSGTEHNLGSATF